MAGRPPTPPANVFDMPLIGPPKLPRVVKPQSTGTHPKPRRSAPDQIVRALGAIKTRPGEGPAVARNRRIAYLVQHTGAINAAQKGAQGQRVQLAVNDAVGVPRHPDIGERFAHDLVTAGVNTVVAAPTIARAIGADYGDIVSGRAKKSGRPWSRTRAMVHEGTHAVVEDVKHPLRHPGNTLLDVTAFGVGSASRLGQAGAAVRAAGRAGAAEQALASVARGSIRRRHPEVGVPIRGYYQARGEPAAMAGTRARAGEKAYRQSSLRAKSKPAWVTLRTQEASRWPRAQTPTSPFMLGSPSLFAPTLLTQKRK